MITKHLLIRKILQHSEAKMPNEARWLPLRRVDAEEASQDGSSYWSDKQTHGGSGFHILRNRTNGRRYPGWF
jgi:hypothetical protein